jgi:hypothetical protein
MENDGIGPFSGGGRPPGWNPGCKVVVVDLAMHRDPNAEGVTYSRGTMGMVR